MTVEKLHDNINATSGWIDCSCGRHLLKTQPDTEAKNLPLFCRVCKKTTVVDIERGRSARRRSP